MYIFFSEPIVVCSLV